jgi:Tol biopolymer transport system component
MRRLLLPLAGLAALAGAAPVAEAGLAGASGRIVYAASRTDVGQGDFKSTEQVFQTVDSDGRRNRFVQGCRRVDGTPTDGNCDVSYRSPVWSPNGRRLAFDAGESLALIAPSGGDLKVLPPVSENDGEPAFSPSGAQLAFSAKTRSRRDIRVVSTDGTGPRLVVRNGASPDWSKRGRIAFVRRGTLYSVRPGGEGLRRLTRGSDPSWSLSGRRIAFARSGGIYVARSDGKRVRRVVRCSGCEAPSLSPDGRYLVYDDRGLHVARVSDGKRLETLVDDVRGSFEASDPDWRPR